MKEKSDNHTPDKAAALLYKGRALLGSMAAAVILIFFAGTAFAEGITLKVGVFCGSTWDSDNAGIDSFMEYAADAFQKKEPGTRIEIDHGIREEDYAEELAQQLLLGTEPDLFFIPSGNLEDMTLKDTLLPLDTYLEKDTDAVKGIYPNLLEGNKTGGSTYALPVLADPMLMCVNFSLLHRFALKTPGREWTWSDFHRICRQATRDTNRDGEDDYFGIAGYDWKMAAVSDGAGEKSQDEEPDMTDPLVRASVRFADEINELAGRRIVNTDDFQNGIIAFTPVQASVYRKYAVYPYSVLKYSHFTWSCTEMPAGPSGGNVSTARMLSAGISSESRHREAAWKFLKFISTDPDMQSELMSYSYALPVLRSTVQKAEEKDRQINYDCLDRVLETACVYGP